MTYKPDAYIGSVYVHEYRYSRNWKCFITVFNALKLLANTPNFALLSVNYYFRMGFYNEKRLYSFEIAPLKEFTREKFLD